MTLRDRVLQKLGELLDRDELSIYARIDEDGNVDEMNLTYPKNSYSYGAILSETKQSEGEEFSQDVTEFTKEVLDRASGD